MTDSRFQRPDSLRPALRPDARLVGLHAERGDPGTRLADALAELEGADWGLLFAGEAALARQLVALLGPGTLRIDGRLDIDRAAFAEVGLAVADLHGDLTGARAAWLLEPDERTLERAARAGVRVLVDATLAPGGGWPQRGAEYLVYRNGFTLCGHADAPLAALFGSGQLPAAAAPAPSPLALALALRDVATLPLRLARAARTTSNVAARLGGVAREAGPTALLLPPEAAADTLSPLGGVLAAARHVPEGVLLTPGLEDTAQVLAMLRDPGEAATQGNEGTEDRLDIRAENRAESRIESRERHSEERRPREERREERPERRMPRRFERGSGSDRNAGERNPSERNLSDRNPSERNQRRDFRPDLRPRPDFRPAPDQPASSRTRPDQTPASSSLERFTFERPSTERPSTERPGSVQPVQPSPPSPSEEQWEPEIVFSDLQHTPPPLTHTVSSGPDAPDQGELPQPHVAAEIFEAAAEPATTAALPARPEPTLAALTPDLPATQGPAGKEDPAANLSEEQAAIYARLRDWRNAEAKQQEISRFIIASNATLAEIARRVPYTEADLRAVKGMGPERMKKYGARILEVVRG